MAHATCIDCSATFAPQLRGRPRKRCFDCSPRHEGPKRVAFKQCAGCGREFRAKSGRHRFCTSKCQVSDQQMACANCAQPMLRGATSLPEGKATCLPCRRRSPAYQPMRERGIVEHHTCGGCGGRWERLATRGQRPKWCPDCRSKGHDRRCAHCSTVFATPDARSRYCSLRCSSRARYGWSTSTELVHVPRPTRSTVAPVTEVVGPKRWVGFIFGACGWCSEHFMAATTAFTDRYCSPRCGRRAAKGRRRFAPHPRLRASVYERDSWVCQLCFEPVDRMAHYLDDWAPSLDHIEPQSSALIPDHSPGNLRTAHRWCNSVRGDGRWHEDFFEEVA